MACNRVTRRTRGAANLLEMVEVRFEFLERHRVILDGHVLGNELLAVTLLDLAAQPQILRGCAPQLAVPVHTGAADASAQDERAVAAVRRRHVVGRMADG
jgi:hypothetical protein